MEPLVINGYDLSAVVNVAGRRKIENMERLVRKPNKELLAQLTAELPSRITCFIKKDENTTGDGTESAWILLIGLSNKVIYLGWVINRQPAIDNWKQAVRLEENLELKRQIEEKGPFVLYRDVDYDYIIPMDAPVLTLDVYEEAIRKCLRVRAPYLSNLPVSWLTEEIATKLSKVIDENSGEPEDSFYDTLLEDAGF